jgi:hypothetical protein
VTEAGDGGAARTVDIAAAILVGDGNALPCNCRRQTPADGTMESWSSQLPGLARTGRSGAPLMTRLTMTCNICLI